MQLSKKSEYALRALINIGLADSQGQKTVPGAALAQADRLPLKYVERILQELRTAGIIETQRGKFGGYGFATDPAEIGIGDVVRLMEGKVAPIACASECAYRPCSCPDEAHCGLRMLMIDVRNAIVAILDRYSLADVVGVTLRKYLRDGIQPPFSERRDHTAPAVEPQADLSKADPVDGFLSLLVEQQSTQPSPK